jgi:hypothetical protein
MNTLLVAVLMSLAGCVAAVLLMRRHGTYSRRTQRLVAGTGASLGGLGLLLLALRDLT